MSSSVNDCTGIILAGGENIRMPVLKAFIKVNGEKIIEKNLNTLKNIFKETAIVTNQPDIYFYLGVPMYGDVYDIRGPMTGIFTSLLNAPTEWVFTSACDMPFINGKLICYMASKRDGYDAVVPVFKGKREPLFSFYSKRLLRDMEDSINADKTGLSAFLSNKKVKYVTTREIKKIDSRGESFVNLNTPEDVKLFTGKKV